MATRRAYRLAAARTLGACDTGTATAGSTVALLEMTAWPFKSTIAQDERYEHRIIHRPDALAAADRVRAVKTGGYAPLTGTFVPDQGWSAAPYAGGVGEAIELLGVLDPDNLHRLVNAALGLVPLTVEVTFASLTSQARRHSLATAAPWLDDPTRVYQVGRLGPADARADSDPFRSSVRGVATERGGVVYLEGMAFAPTDTAYALVSRPASTYCRASAGVYGDKTNGLELETDEAPVPEDVVAAGVKMLAWDEFGDLFWPGEDQTAARKVTQAAARFWALVRENWPEPERRLAPVRYWGPPASARVPW